MRLLIPLAYCICALSLVPPVSAQNDPLAKGFRNPPDSAKPHTWWHWMDGNVTREGITADLEAMKRVGIGGAQMFHVAVGIPKGPVGYMSAQWREMVTHAVKEANRLGLELCIHNCAGWSSSGGPWIKPEYAMQKLVWSETSVRGPTHFSEVLPKPETRHVVRAIPFYRDVCVLAFRNPPAGDTHTPEEQILGKTGVVRQDGIQPDISESPAGIAITRQSVVTDKMDTSGRLTWDVPQGDWTILRIGYTPTGKDNHPAPPEGDGLEVDKLSREALDVHWNGMMAKVIQDVGPLAGKVLNNSLIDSYEVGSQNWTPRFREEFQRRRGYDPIGFLAVITGRTFINRETSERFLWDFRRTIADLYADNYYGYFGELCHKHGMKFSTEPYGNGGFDNIQAGGRADIPMGEFWVPNGAAIETTKVASSVGHTYGRKVVGAESFTADDQQGRWLVQPYGIKALGDLVFCHGINRYIFHRYAHQPWMNLKPGMTMGPWGTHLERTVTWWNEAPAWLKYVARCQYLLQEGRFVADALYFYGEGAPNDLTYRPGLRPQLPAGYDYDGCDATVVYGLAVRDGRVVLPSGMSYRVLVLPDSQFMTPPMARMIRALVQTGATVVGPKPKQSPSLTGYPTCDEDVRRVADEVWGDLDGSRVKEHAFGKGRVVWGRPLQEVFKAMSASPDFEFTGNGAKLAYIHRKIGDADVYFVSNQKYRPAEVECTFRVSGRAPELWHADTGTTEPAPVFRDRPGRTLVQMRLEPAESVFVVFRHPVAGNHLTSFKLIGKESAPERAPRVSIVKARYETPDGRGADVTSKVKEMVAEGQFEIPATNTAYGDPVPNVVKQLRVDYEVDGKPMQKTVGENETLALVEAVETAPEFPAYQIVTDKGGIQSLLLWLGGSYSLAATGRPTMDPTSRNPSPRTFTISGPWDIRFPSGLGAPASVRLDHLTSWATNDNPGVRYFSGTATYSKAFDVPPSMDDERRVVWLDLGRVKNFAHVRLNGRDLGTLWKAPFRVEVSGLLKPSMNRLEIEITNLWPNRLIGDEQLPPDVEWNGVQLKKWPDWLVQGKPRPQTGRITFTTWRFYNKDSPLLESGLIGPVTLRSVAKFPINRIPKTVATRE